MLRPTWHWPTGSQGKFAESEPLAREAVEFDRKKRPDELATTNLFSE
jgi:hypothetical protein